MATNLKNLSVFNTENVSAKGMKIAIVVAEWNEHITFALRDGAIKTLINLGAEESDIRIDYVPGTYELAMGAQIVARYHPDAIITIGCVIQGETPHFDYICQGASLGIMQAGLSANIPVIFGVLTTNNEQEALDRCGGKHGNKGDEAAYTAVKMAFLNKKY